MKEAGILGRLLGMKTLLNNYLSNLLPLPVLTVYSYIYRFYNLQRTIFITLRYGDFPDIVNSLQVYRPPRDDIFFRDRAAANVFHGRGWVAIDS